VAKDAEVKTAVEMAKEQRSISVAEFFEKTDIFLVLIIQQKLF